MSNKFNITHSKEENTKEIPERKRVTTNVFTATILPISSSAGITAAAGTRLALNLLLETLSRGLSFQSTTNCSC